MSNRRPMVFSRVEPALLEELQSEADRRFDGNLSLLVRDAVKVYIRLRSKLGNRFELTVDELTGTEDEKAAA